MQAAQPFLVYRDRIGVPSEVAFLRRQYVGFTRLHPIWVGRTLLPAAAEVSVSLLRLGGNGPWGPVHRLLFRTLGWLPNTPAVRSAPVIHAQFARGGALALPLARALGLPLAVTLHGGDITKQKNWHGTVLARRWPGLLRETRHFVCVSGAVAEAAMQRGVSAGKLIVLPIGVEVPDHPQARTPLVHLFVGRFVEKKGITVLAEAMRHLRAEGDQTRLVCIGDGPLRPLLDALARDVPGITLTGWQPPDMVHRWMHQAFSLLVPSIIASNGDAEGLPSVIPEAMAQGCPVIGSDQGGIAEAIRHQQTGLLVPPNDATALAAAMRRLTTDLVFADTLGHAGFDHAARMLNAMTQSRKLEALLFSML